MVLTPNTQHTDCRPVPGQKGAYNCSYEGQWAQVTTDPGTNITQVPM